MLLMQDERHDKVYRAISDCINQCISSIAATYTLESDGANTALRQCPALHPLIGSGFSEKDEEVNEAILRGKLGDAKYDEMIVYCRQLIGKSVDRIINENQI